MVKLCSVEKSITTDPLIQLTNLFSLHNLLRY